MTIKGNVEIVQGRRPGMLGVKVAGVRMQGVVEVTIAREVKARLTRPDGWQEVVPGDAYVSVKIPLRLVTVKS